MGKIRITQVRSAVSRPKDQGRTLRALGIHRMNESVEQEETPSVMGMVRKVSHLVKVEPISSGRGSRSETS